LAEHFGPFRPDAIPFEDMKERMLFVEALETVRCLDEGVITSIPDANIGSIMGIGFPPWTGGVVQFINGYAGGLTGFVAGVARVTVRHGVTINGLLPGPFDTDRLRGQALSIVVGAEHRGPVCAPRGYPESAMYLHNDRSSHLAISTR